MDWLASTVHAAEVNPVVAGIIDKIAVHILNPLIALVFAVAIVVFLWGLFGLIKGADDPSEREKAKQHVIWGIVGMFIMVSAYGIIYLVLNTFDIPIPDALR